MELEKLLRTLGFIKRGMRRAIGENQTIHAELAIVRPIAKIAPVSPMRFAVFIFLAQRLIDPIPNKTAL